MRDIFPSLLEDYQGGSRAVQSKTTGALTAGGLAVGVVAMGALPSNAHAQVTYVSYAGKSAATVSAPYASNANGLFNPGPPSYIDGFNFYLTANDYSTPPEKSTSTAYISQSNIAASIPSGSTHYALTELAKDTVIGPATGFTNNPSGYFHYFNAAGAIGTNFTAAQAGWSGVTGYIGFKAPRNGQEYYGWAKITTNSDATTVTLDGFAFNATPGASILAGQTTAIPEPANAAALLALGAAGLVLYRQRKKLKRAAA